MVMRLRILVFVGALLAVLTASAVSSYAQAPAWPTRPVRFIVPLGPGAAADIGARLFADKLSQRWGQPVVVENRPGGDSIIAITAFLSANDDHILLYMPSGNFTVHPFLHSKLPYDPYDLNPIVRTSNTILAVALAKNSPYNTIREFTEAARANPGKFNSGLVPGLTEFTFWAYTHHEKLNIPQVPYRDINMAPTDLAEGRIQVVMASLAIVQPQWRADRIKLIALNNKERTPLVPGVPTAVEEGYPSLIFEGLHGLIGLKTMSKELRQKIAADFKEAAADGSIAARMAATGSVINVGGPDEFAAAIEEQRATIAATVKAINFKPRN
jgi:tripartite-type tricarboxylate transporter receptor subunit TctC